MEPHAVTTLAFFAVQGIALGAMLLLWQVRRDDLALRERRDPDRASVWLAWSGLLLMCLSFWVLTIVIGVKVLT